MGVLINCGNLNLEKKSSLRERRNLEIVITSIDVQFKRIQLFQFVFHCFIVVQTLTALIQSDFQNQISTTALDVDAHA